ncbi:YdcF family protein [Halalkalibacter flavus]|jgi:uncharacterized SAM-binding protein YcdF (DUF218 family)|uniref:YdcF family protein n=1 Tax=Halalkalibacter flavus TaxID=3090668 RepID=UPI002FC6E24C
MGKKSLIIILISSCILFFYVCFLHIQIIRYSHIEIERDIDYVIILGARVKGAEPSLSLKYRIEAAAEYVLENEEVVVIATGGQGAGEDITEAEAIKTELMRKGIEEARIFLEDESTTTVENIRLSKKHIPDISRKGLVVTNRYHVYRATMIAQDQQLDITGLPAKTPRAVLLQSYLREYLAITKYFFTRNFN